MKLEREAGNLVQFLAEGNESAAVRKVRVKPDGLLGSQEAAVARATVALVRSGLRTERGQRAATKSSAPSSHRRRDALDWLGILAKTAVIVVVLATPLDEQALVLALAIGLRGGRLILDIDC